MHDHLESIIADLYALDPSLRERDNDVRTIVHALITEKPDVHIDSLFVTNLRRSILTAPQKIQTPWTAWLVHLAPIGAIALITLILVPELTSPTPLPKATDPAADSFAVEAPTMMSAKNIADTSGPESTSLMQAADNFVPSDSFTLAPQQPGSYVYFEYALLTTPGFISINRVESNGDIGERIGVSTLLGSGSTTSFSVPLTVPMVIGDIFYAVLYPDNGDGVFTDNDTTPYVLGDAVPMNTLFSIDGEGTVPSDMP